MSAPRDASAMALAALREAAEEWAALDQRFMAFDDLSSTQEALANEALELLRQRLVVEATAEATTTPEALRNKAAAAKILLRSALAGSADLTEGDRALLVALLDDASR